MNRLSLAAAFAAALSLSAGFANAAPEKYLLDASHSQIVFTYNHLGFSTTTTMFSGFEGEIMFDAEAPAGSSVAVSFPVKTMLTGWEARFAHFMAPDFFGDHAGDMVEFTSTAINVTGDKTADITGDLTLNGVTKPVTLKAILNQAGQHPMAGKPWAGFDASATVKRTDYNLGEFAPYVSDEVEIYISIEAMKAD